MTTLAEFRANLRTSGNFPTNDTRITDAVVNREVNRALKRIALLHDWPWLQAERTIITAASQRSYALPDDFLRLLSIRHDGESNTLWLRSIQEVDDIVGEGKPQVFAVWGGKISFGSTPSGEYTLKMRYVSQENVLVNDSDTPLIPAYWEDGVYEAALVELHRQARQLDESGLAESRFTTWLTESQDNIRQTRGSARVRVRPGSLI